MADHLEIANESPILYTCEDGEHLFYVKKQDLTWQLKSITYGTACDTIVFKLKHPYYFTTWTIDYYQETGKIEDK